MRGRVAAGLFAIALGMASTPATVSAHHSFAAFTMTSEKTIAGTVKQVDWTNPHTWIWVNVTNGQGTVETFGFEGMSPNYLARRGWSKSTLKPGDKISVTFRPMRDGSNGGMFMNAKLPTGQVLSMTGLPIDQ
jgi:DNA/RNA endonuclease YhcR with UshA esterase domain